MGKMYLVAFSPEINIRFCQPQSRGQMTLTLKASQLVSTLEKSRVQSIGKIVSSISTFGDIWCQNKQLIFR